ncbi:MAG: YkgJ family cysteine cluster protein [Promethearchaeota archaeon]|nr:MAG: YkgJ family cysteine cluster protein [Candidatus Lokiarchaeota archaeon]
MYRLKYECLKCGICCSIPQNLKDDYIKRIPLYPEEVDRLIEIAKYRNLPFKVKEDLVFPDIKNKKILVLTYRFILRPQGRCVFYDVNKGCIIHEEKPYACQAYPLAIRRIDSFNIEITIDPLCNFVSENYASLKDISIDRIKDIFVDEYPKAEKFYEKNKRLQLKIRRLEEENKIQISRQITLKQFNYALNNWDRKEIRVK